MGHLRASLGSTFAVFGNRDLARLIYGWAAITVATWTFAIALAVYAFDRGGATAVGVAALVRLLPGALVSPFAGLLGDRRSRRLLLVLSSALCGVAIALAALAVALGADPGRLRMRRPLRDRLHRLHPGRGRALPARRAHPAGARRGQRRPQPGRQRRLPRRLALDRGAARPDRRADDVRRRRAGGLPHRRARGDDPARHQAQLRGRGKHHRRPPRNAGRTGRPDGRLAAAARRPRDHRPGPDRGRRRRDDRRRRPRTARAWRRERRLD